MLCFRVVLDCILQKVADVIVNEITRSISSFNFSNFLTGIDKAFLCPFGYDYNAVTLVFYSLDDLIIEALRSIELVRKLRNDAKVDIIVGK